MCTVFIEINHFVLEGFPEIRKNGNFHSIKNNSTYSLIRIIYKDHIQIKSKSYVMIINFAYI